MIIRKTKLEMNPEIAKFADKLKLQGMSNNKISNAIKEQFGFYASDVAIGTYFKKIGAFPAEVLFKQDNELIKKVETNAAETVKKLDAIENNIWKVYKEIDENPDLKAAERFELILKAARELRPLVQTQFEITSTIARMLEDAEKVTKEEDPLRIVQKLPRVLNYLRDHGYIEFLKPLPIPIKKSEESGESII